MGLLAFNMLSGRNIVFEKSVRKVMKEAIVEEQSIDKNIGRSESESTSLYINGVKKLVEVEEITWIPMENGQVYEGDLFIKKVDNPSLDFPAGTDGIYATITTAVADLNLREVSGPVNFLLTDYISCRNISNYCEYYGWTELRHRLFKLQIEMEWFEKWVHGRTYQWEAVPSGGDPVKAPTSTATPNR